GEQRLMALEEIGIVLQIGRDRVFLVLLGGQPSGFSCRHALSNLDMACEGYLRRARQPDVLSRTVPVYSQLAAAHADVHLPVELAPAPPHRNRGARPRAAGQRLTGAALIDTQTDVRAVHDLHEP